MSVETNPDLRLEWIEPTVAALELSETANAPSSGGDGGGRVDCTRS